MHVSKQNPISAHQAAIAAALRAQAGQPPPAAAPAKQQPAAPVDRFDAPPAHAAGAKKNPSAPGQNRPQVTLAHPIKRGVDAEGKKGPVPAGPWAVSAVAGNKVVLYNPKHDGDMRVVNRSDFVKAAANRGRAEAVLKHRGLPTAQGPTPPPGTLPVQRVQAADGAGQGFRPPGSGGKSITGRGNPPAVWGTSTPNMGPKSRTGFAGLPMGQDTEFAPIPGTERQQEFDNPDGRTATATWVQGWAHVGNQWVKQWMVKRLEPHDGSAPIDLLQ